MKVLHSHQWRLWLLNYFTEVMVVPVPQIARLCFKLDKIKCISKIYNTYATCSQDLILFRTPRRCIFGKPIRFLEGLRSTRTFEPVAKDLFINSMLTRPTCLLGGRSRLHFE